MPPIMNASAKLPRLAPPPWKLLEKREKSISKMSNIASASSTNTRAIATLNQGEAFSVPNVPAVRIDDQTEHAVDEAMAAP